MWVTKWRKVTGNSSDWPADLCLICSTSRTRLSITAVPPELHFTMNTSSARDFCRPWAIWRAGLTLVLALALALGVRLTTNRIEE
jgi:hypothetical protein